VPSATELDSARAALARAVAIESSAAANVGVAKATLSTDETNLAKASIRSPLDGVVLSRSVDPGNAVAASLQAVTLFAVAEDLTQLQLEASVDEADVGAVKVGQKASFTVSAYPSRRFPATIVRVAYGSTTTNNVVTYVATLDVDNSDLEPAPRHDGRGHHRGHRARGRAAGAQHRAALLAPAQPPRRASPRGSSILSKMMPRPPRSSSTKVAGTESKAPGTRQIWVLQEASRLPCRCRPASATAA
jgi:HlyD family secretion protein